MIERSRALTTAPGLDWGRTHHDTATVAHLAPPLLAWADYLAQRGFRVFRVNTRKRPLDRDWPNLATTDRAIIRGWWARTPFACPAYSLPGLLAVDIDTVAGHGVDGPATWRRLAADRPVPVTWQVHSPTGSVHLVFTRPDGLTVTSGANKLGPGADVKTGPGAYLVGPGAWTLAGTYTLVCDADPAPCPQWLLRELCPAPIFRRRVVPRLPVGDAYVAAALADEARAVADAPVSTRNDRLNIAAFALARFVLTGVMDEQMMTDALTDAALTAGLSEREAQATIRSALRARERAT